MFRFRVGAPGHGVCATESSRVQHIWLLCALKRCSIAMDAARTPAVESQVESEAHPWRPRTHEWHGLMQGATQLSSSQDGRKLMVHCTKDDNVTSTASHVWRNSAERRRRRRRAQLYCMYLAVEENF